MTEEKKIDEPSPEISRKRSHSLMEYDEADHRPHYMENRSKPSHSKELKQGDAPSQQRTIEKSRTQITNELYVNLVAEMMYPTIEFGPYGHSAENNRYPIERTNTLGYLLNPLRKRTVFEKWSPYEIAVFEGSITLFGKNFHKIQQNIETKTVKEIIEFYYEWKKTQHYKEWKKQYFPDERDFV